MSRKTAVAFDAATARKDPELRNTWDVLSAAVRAGPRYVPSPRSRKENRVFCVTFFSSSRIDSPGFGQPDWQRPGADDDRFSFHAAASRPQLIRL